MKKMTSKTEAQDAVMACRAASWVDTKQSIDDAQHRRANSDGWLPSEMEGCEGIFLKDRSWNMVSLGWKGV
jgi:hypothetical protein